MQIYTAFYNAIFLQDSVDLAKVVRDIPMVQQGLQKRQENSLPQQTVTVLTFMI